MSDPNGVVDSPVGWAHEHVDRYVESGGASGHEWRPGVATLLVTIIGRRTGLKRRTALIYGRDGEDYVVVASKGGSPRHPEWYLNLQVHPEVQVQVGTEVFPARAETVRGPERAELWRRMTAIWPDYDRYQARTAREIPVVRLVRT